MFHEGQQIGQYTLIRKLGKGGFGEVWLAEKRSQFVTKRVAVKLPLDEQINFDAIRQEATLWEQASGHANVLPIIDADEVDGQVVIVSEYASGGSLADKLKTHGRFSIQQAIETTIGILNGLEYLHSKRIIHRDIKPQNILLQGDTPRLADFGISRVMQTAAISSTITGTDAYMSPESFQGERTIQTDIWAVGVVLYQLLKGFLPFPQENPSERMYAILQKDFEPIPAYIPHHLKIIIAKALAKLPENRYRTASEMREDLRRILAGVNLSKTPNQKETVVIPSHLPKLPKTSSETETVIKPKSSSNPKQPEAVSPRLNIYENQIGLPELTKSITSEKKQPKYIGFKSFGKLFLGALVVAGVIVAFIKLFESYTKISNLKTENNFENSRNTAVANTPNQNKEIPTPTPRKKNRINNVNVATNNSTQEIKPTQNINEFAKQDETGLREQVTIAYQGLENAMLQTAQNLAISRHKSSTLEQCYTSPSDFVALTETRYERSYKCRLKGKILGIRKFEVGIKVTGEIVMQENIINSRILSANIIYDNEF